MQWVPELSTQTCDGWLPVGAVHPEPPHPWHSCLITLFHFSLFQPFLCFPSGPFPAFLLPSFLVEWPARVSPKSRASFAILPMPRSSDVPKCSMQRSQKEFGEHNLGLILAVMTRGARSWLPVQPQELLQAPASSQARCWSHGKVVSGLLEPQCPGSAPCKWPHANEELAKAGEAVGLGEGGFIPPNPSWVL